MLKPVLFALVAILIVGGLAYGASLFFNGKPTATPTPSLSPAPAVSSAERSSVTGKPLASTQLQVSALNADNADITTLLVKALQVTATIALQGDLSAVGNGSFGGIVTAANFRGNGAQLTGVDAATLNGQPGSFYRTASNLSGTLRADQLPGDVAFVDAANTFTAANTFSAATALNGTVNIGSSLSVTGPASLASLGLATALPVGSGGTGLAGVTNQAVLYGTGGASLATASPAGAGLCLLSGATDLQWGSCSGGGGGVASLDGLTGVLTIAGSTGAGSTITLNDATTASKGIASFNGTNFTVTSGAVNTIQNITTTSTPTFAGVNTNAITPSAALTAGATSQSFTLQGNASSVVTATNGANTTTVSFQAPTANATFRFLAAAAGTYDICTTAGNCVGTGGGVTTPGGTTNRVPKFTGSQTLGDSLISDNGATVTIGGTLAVNTITPTGALTIGATAQNLTLQGAGVSLTATSGGTTNALTFATPSGGAKTITLPNASGTVAVSASGPLGLDSAGNLTCATCLTSGGGSGVVSLNTLTGALTIANATTAGSTITISDATTASKGIASFNSTNFSVASGAVNTIQNIATTSTPTFAGVNTNALTPSAALTLGAAAQQFTLQGNASSTITSTGGGFTTTVGFTGTPTGAVTYNFDRAAAVGTYAICTTAGNCTGTGGGVTTPGGSTNSIAKFTAGQVVGDSTLTDNGTTVSTSIDLTIQGGDLTIGTTSQAASLLLHDGNGQTTTLQAGNSVGNLTFVLPTSAGATNQCLKQSGSGNQLFWDDCDGGAGGGGSGVVSLNTLTGALTIANATTGGSTITINDATTASKGLASFNSTNFTVASGAVDTIQSIATSSTPTFAGVALTGAGTALSVSNNATIGGTLGVTGNLTTSALLTANSGSISTTLNVGTTTTTDVLSVTNNAGVGGTLNVTGAGGIIIGNASTAGLLSFRDGSSSFGAAFQPATLTANRTIAIPNANGTLAVSASAPLALDAAGNLTVSDATTAAKGVASFNSTNFSVTSGAVNTIQNINSTATPTFTGVNANAITPSAALTVGATGQSFTLQGNASSTITATGGGFTTAVGFTGSPTGAVTYNFDRAATPGTYTICSTAGNCAGTGGGVTTPGGTTNRLSKFTASGVIGNSSVLDNGSSLTLDSNVDLLLQGASAYISNPQSQTASEALGLNAAVAGSNSLAVGNGATTHVSGGSVAVGTSAFGGVNGTSVGYQANAQGNGVALGSGAFGDSGGIALGASASTAGFDNSIAIGRGATTTATNQLVIGSASPGNISQVVIGNGATHATPTGFTLQGTSGSGSNVAGASINLASGQGTGTAAGGTINLQVSSAGGTGSTLNPLSSVASFSSTAVTLNRNTTIAANQNLIFADGSGQLQLDSDGEVYFREQGSTDTDLLEAFARAGYVFYTNTGQDVLEVSQNGLTTVAAGTDAFGGLLVTQSNGNSVFGVSTAGGEGSVGVGYASDGQATPFYLDADASSDPTGGKGAMYYNGSTDKFRCYQNTGWTDCITATSTLQQAYTASTGSTTPEIKLDSTRNGIDIQDANTTIGSGQNFITLRSANAGGLGNAVFSVGIQGNLFMQPAANRTDLFDINDNGGGNLLTLDSSNDRLGFNLGGTNAPNLTGNGIDVKGALKLSSSGSSANFDQNCSTPGGSNLPARFCVAPDDNSVGFFGSIAQMGLTAAANTQTTASVLSLFDGRTVAHSLTLRVYSPDETKLVGFTWDGSSTQANVQTDNKATGDSAGLRVKTGDTAGTSNSSGTLTITSGDGLGTNTSSGNVVIDTGTKTGTGTTGSVNIGATNATVIGLGKTSGGNTATTINGTAIVKPTSGNDSTAAFQVQNAAGTATVLDVDTTNKFVGVGTNAPITQFHVAGIVPTTYLQSLTTSIDNPYDMVAQGHFLYAALYGKLRIYDITRPGSMVSLGTVTTGTGVAYLQVVGKYAYMTVNNGNVYIVDVSNPASPTLTTTLAISSLVSARVQGRYLYATTADGSNNIKAYDISNPAAPALVSSLAQSNSGYTVVLGSHYLYTTSGGSGTLNIIDISNPASMSSVSSSLAVGGGAVAINGRYLYIADSSNTRIRAIDVSNAASPSITGTFTTASAPNNVYIQGRYAYVSLGGGASGGFQIVDISNPASMSGAGTVTVGGSVLAVSVQGRYLYAGDYTNNFVQSYDLGGAYIQQLEAGGIEASTISANGTLSVSSLTDLRGGLSVAQGALITGNTGINGSLLLQNPANSTSALQVLNAAGTTTVLGVDTTNSLVTTGISLKVGAAAGNGAVLTNNGATLNTALALTNFASGGSIGTAAATVDIYTAITVNQTTASQTLTVPSPTNTAAGRLVYISNIGSTSFTLLGAVLNNGVTATLVWNGSAWTYAGADGTSIINQASSDQTANFRIVSASAGSIAASIQGAASATQPVLLVKGGATPGAGGDLFQMQNSSSTLLAKFTSAGDLAFGESANHTISTTTRATNAAGRSLTISAGSAGSGASPFDGGNLTLQAGSAAGTGAADGGDVILQSGDRVGGGDAGHVIVKSGSGDVTTDPFFQVQKSDGSRAFAVYTGTGPGHLEAGGTVSNVSYDLTFSADNAASDRVIGVDDSDATDAFGDGKNLVLHAGSTSVSGSNGGSVILTGGNKSGAGTVGGVTVKNVADSTGAFKVQNAAATLTLFSADSTNNKIQVGSATSDSTAVFLIVDNYDTLADPTGGVPGAIYYNEASESFRCAEAERWTDCLGVPKPNTRRWTYITYPGSGTAFDANGDVYGGNTGNAVAATTTEPGMLDYGTAASTNSASSIEGNLNYNTSSNPTYQTYMALTNTANARVWAGLTNQTAATMAASDNPAGNYAAFRYSTAAGDTTYKCITKDGTTQTIADSGVAPGTGGHKFEILHLASGQTTFKIDGGWACANTTHLPASSTMTRYVNTITTLTNAVRSIRVGWVYVESDK